MEIRSALVTGACGFVGTALTQRLLSRGINVMGIDNLSRSGAAENAIHLRASYPHLRLLTSDLRDWGAVDDAVASFGACDAVFHLAGQVAVTKSFSDPRADLEGNVVATVALLESVRRHTPDAYCLLASTNKVYGAIDVRTPVGCDQPLDPATPYGVSKAAAELYFREYGRPPIGMSTCSLRQSCIYGPRQFGVADQGWVAWFVIANVLGMPLVIYGDGEQVRDLLYVDDLVDLYLECVERRLQGTYPTGGGTANAISLNGALQLIEKSTGRAFSRLAFSPPRPCDQEYFVADLSWAKAVGLEWNPTTAVGDGIERLTDWVVSNEALVRSCVVADDGGGC